MKTMLGLSATKTTGKIIVLQQIEIIMFERIVKCAMGVLATLQSVGPQEAQVIISYFSPD